MRVCVLLCESSHSVEFFINGGQLALENAHLLFVAHDDLVDRGLQAGELADLVLLAQEVLLICFLQRTNFGPLALIPVKVDACDSDANCQGAVPVGCCRLLRSRILGTLRREDRDKLDVI